MTSPLVVPEPVSQAVIHFLSLLDEANVLAELGRFQEAESRFAQARQLAGDDRGNELLVDIGRLCLWIQQANHSQALAAITDCLQKYDDLLSVPENGCLRQDLLAQRAFTLVELHRWQSAGDVLPALNPEVETTLVPDEQSLRDEMEAAYRV